MLCFYSCQNDDLNITNESETFIAVNLETFVASSDLDDSPKGKYVGVMGHHTNADIHGKIIINSGEKNQYSALVQMTNGSSLKFKGIPQTKDASIVLFENSIGSFIMNFEDFNNPVQTSVQFTNELTDGYIVAQKSTKGVDSFVLTGTYIDTTNPAFNGNWDVMGNGAVVIVDVEVTVPGFPIPVTVNIPTENIGTLVVTHTGSTTPIMDSDFEGNGALACIEAAIGTGFSNAPFIIPSDIPNPLGGAALGGAGSISSGGQTSLLNGFDASWSLSFGAPIPLAGIPGGFSDDNCMPAASGTWSWNGRTGTISITSI